MFGNNVPVIQSVCEQHGRFHVLDFCKQVAIGPELIVVAVFAMPIFRKEFIAHRAIAILARGRIATVHVVIQEIDVFTKPTTGVSHEPIAAVVMVV